MPNHHLPEDLLMEYAAGSTAEAVSLAVACHLALCGSCTARLHACEALGGALLHAAAPVPLAEDAAFRLLARLDEEPARTPPPLMRSAAAAAQGLPTALHPYVGEIPEWRFVMPGVRMVPLDTGDGHFEARLLRFRAGMEVPNHSHEGDEYTVVFSGGIEESGSLFHRGDVCLRQTGESHLQRVLPDEACVALVVNGGPLVPLTWKGRLARLLLR